ncbi:DUF697 domain-containing protein [Marinoscillum furvescens]|uniref:Uncharacterized protein DUF697 n=1 Tax=Marinoscillum furvescens DSM 4134 TaxID=1122208 RepID=A0A3D9L6I5_MARFU|nr:DUF697 domain-containing protein [Marinoscillum furvescens]REE01768.1 uncharacterized protein DUF697 [Marinoscillum furvescens DSM 4134]
MIQTLRKIVLPLALVVLIGFVLFLVNQVSGLYILLGGINELLALAVVGVVSAVLLGLLLWPLVVYLKLPAPLKLPGNEQELVRYREKLLKRLQKNTLLKREDAVPRNVAGLEKSLEVLDAKAGKVIRETASAVFLTTSVSQNGKLDALTILATQSQMVWKVAHVYYQRPTLRELVYLYANVAGASFLASEIEDLDISQQIEPVVKSFVKNSAGRSLPVVGPTAHLVLDSLLEGSTNAFLTLRVGHIAKKYCSANAVTHKGKLKREAFTVAAKELKVIVVNSSASIMAGLMKATRKAGLDTLKSGLDSIRQTGEKVADGVSSLGKKVNPFGKKEKKVIEEKASDPS